ncbi:hypothetical protein K501DRAFT_307532 [Backusella circina FSU 941]|nr:hypothetical protein K501DRAFT_307532 [Backusella circina FSU 941]
MYRALDSSKMRQLSFGTIVEKKIEEFAIKCNYKHPCHSILFDSKDSCWEDVFSPEDLNEIKTHKFKEPSPLPEAFTNYLNTFKSSESDILRIIKLAIDAVFDPYMIDCRSGEKSSNASSDSRNQAQTLANIKQIQRKLPEGKVDMIFKKDIFVQLTNFLPAFDQRLICSWFFDNEKKDFIGHSGLTS